MPCPMSISLCPSAVCCYCMFSFYVCSTWSICCLTGNAMPHVHFTLSISCLLLLYVLILCLQHLVHLLSYWLCHAPCPVHSVHQLSAVTVCSHSMSAALGPFAVLLVMPCPMSISLCPSAVCCYCMLSFYVCSTWSICCLTGNAMPHVHFTLSISCLLLLYVLILCMQHLVHLLSYW